MYFSGLTRRLELLLSLSPSPMPVRLVLWLARGLR
jgi:hypothetical protein